MFALSKWKLRQLSLALSKRNLRPLSLVLIVAGIALLCYVGFEYFSMYSAQQRLAREFEQQQRAAQQGNSSEPQVPNDGLTRISIPKIKLNAVIVEGTSYRKLRLGPGHMRETPSPGEVGNSVITAHRDTFFRHIGELNKGDVITVQRNGYSYHYEVTGKKVVDPSDMSVMKQTDDARLTLITCYPTYYIGPAPERLIVFSKQMASSAPQAHANNAIAEATKENSASTSK